VQVGDDKKPTHQVAATHQQPVAVGVVPGASAGSHATGGADSDSATAANSGSGAEALMPMLW